MRDWENYRHSLVVRGHFVDVSVWTIMKLTFLLIYKYMSSHKFVWYFNSLVYNFLYLKPKICNTKYFQLRIQKFGDKGLKILTMSSVIFSMYFNSLFLLVDRWEGEGLNEVGKDKKTGAVRVKVNPKFFRPTEVVSACISLVVFWVPVRCSCGIRDNCDKTDLIHAQFLHSNIYSS